MGKNIVTRSKMMKDNKTMINKVSVKDNNNKWMNKKDKKKLETKANMMKMIKIWKSIKTKMVKKSNTKTNNNKRAIRNKSITKMMANNKATFTKTTKWTNSSNNNLVQMDNRNLINNSFKCGIVWVTN